MVQPIQYTVKAPSAFESLVSGLKLGTSLQEMQAQRALREQQASADPSEHGAETSAAGGAERHSQRAAGRPDARVRQSLHGFDSGGTAKANARAV
jgi:hypothetical protein